MYGAPILSAMYLYLGMKMTALVNLSLLGGGGGGWVGGEYCNLWGD